jgi:hypothetical protein
MPPEQDAPAPSPTPTLPAKFVLPQLKSSHWSRCGSDCRVLGAEALQPSGAHFASVQEEPAAGVSKWLFSAAAIAGCAAIIAAQLESTSNVFVRTDFLEWVGPAGGREAVKRSLVVLAWRW